MGIDGLGRRGRGDAGVRWDAGGVGESGGLPAEVPRGAELRLAGLEGAAFVFGQTEGGSDGAQEEVLHCLTDTHTHTHTAHPPHTHTLTD